MNYLFKAIVFVIFASIGMAAVAFAFDLCSNHPFPAKKQLAENEQQNTQDTSGIWTICNSPDLSPNATSWQKQSASKRLSSLEGSRVEFTGTVVDVRDSLMGGSLVVLLHSPDRRWGKLDNIMVSAWIDKQRAGEIKDLLVDDIVIIDGLYDNICEVGSAGSFYIDVAINKIKKQGK